MTLADLRPGDLATVLHIVDPTVRAQAIRFGIAEGADIACETVIRSGPVIISRGMMEYAVGYNLAQQIEVVSRGCRGRMGGRGRRCRRGWGRHE